MNNINITLTDTELEFLTNYCESINISIEDYLKDLITKEYNQFESNNEFSRRIRNIIDQQTIEENEKKSKIKIIPIVKPTDGWGKPDFYTDRHI